VAAYWAKVKEANRHRLASGDPDLIEPGEIIVLPPVD
jgi:nucleoid-associated protein YgaU